MIRKSRMATGLAVLIAFGTASCGGSDSTGPESGPDAAIAMQIATALMTQVFTLGFSGGFSDAAPDSGPPTFAAESYQTTAQCPQGGTVAMNGTVTNNLNQQGVGSISLQLTQVPNDCRVQTNDGLYTVNGSPDLNVSAAFDFVQQGVFSAAIDISGGLTWNGSSGSGSCQMNYAANVGQGGSPVTITGTVCGHNF